MRVSKQKMPDGAQPTDKPSRYAIRNAISGPRKKIEVPVMSTHTMERRTAIVTVPRAPWDRDY